MEGSPSAARWPLRTSIRQRPEWISPNACGGRRRAPWSWRRRWTPIWRSSRCPGSASPSSWRPASTTCAGTAGPHECYADRRAGARLGWWSLPVDGFATPYGRPQESGNRTDVRWAVVSGRAEAELSVTRSDDRTWDLSAHRWAPTDLEGHRHLHEVAPLHRRAAPRPCPMRAGQRGVAVPVCCRRTCLGATDHVHLRYHPKSP